MNVSVIIPTLNGEQTIELLIRQLWQQSVKPKEIIVIDSQSDDETAFLAEQNNAKVIRIQRDNFDHGRTRNMAAKEACGEFILFMSQDAIPCDDRLVENLLNAFNNPKVAVSYARQIAGSTASAYEKLIRQFNYPEQNIIKTNDDITGLGIKAFFCSDTCAMYRKDIFEQLGGFEEGLRMDEDMFYAAKLIHSGYAVAYEASAKVFHSHDYNLGQQYQRYKLMGYEITRHEALLGTSATVGDGMKLVKFVSAGLLSKGRVISFIRFGLDCLARYLGYTAGIKEANSESIDNRC